MRSSKWNEVSHKSSARQATGRNVATELTTVWESLTQTKAALRHIENRLDATQRTGVCLDPVTGYPNKKSTRTVPCQDGQDVNAIGGSSKYRGRSQQNPENSSSRSPLKNTTQHSNVHRNSNVERKEPLASSREAVPPTVASSQLGTYNLQSVPVTLDPFSPPQSDHLLTKLVHHRDIRDKHTVSDPNSTCSFALESTEVCYLNDHPDPDTLRTNEQSLLEGVRDPAMVGDMEHVTPEAQVSQNMESKTSSSCLTSASDFMHQVEGTAHPITGSGSQRLGNVRLYQPNDKLEKLKERIRRQRQHLEEAAEEDKLLSYLEKPIPGPGEGSSHGTKSVPTTKIRKVTTAPPAPVYKGFSIKETKLQTPDRKDWKEEEFHNLNRDMSRERDVSRLFEGPTHKQQLPRERRAVRSKERVSPKPVRKVAAGLNAKSVISPASWREGQSLVQMVLGPLPKFPKEDRQSKTGLHPESNRQCHYASRESPPRVQYKHHSLTTPTPLLTDEDKAPVAARSEHLSADIQGILDDLQLDSKAAEKKERARQMSRGGSSGRRGRQGSGSRGRTPISAWVTTSAPTNNSKGCHSPSSKTHQPETTDTIKPGQKMRHYDPDTVRQYIAWQQEERRRHHADEKRAQREETERRNQRLQELYKKQREVAKTLAFATEASVVPVQKQQETCTILLPEETQVDKKAIQTPSTVPSAQARPMYQPSGESDKENKRLESPQSPSSSDRSVTHRHPFPSSSLLLDRPEVPSPATIGSPLEANRHSELLKSTSPVQEHNLNAYIDRAQPSDTASKRNSPSVHCLHTGVSSRNSVDEVDRESLHNSGASGASSRGSNAQSEKSGSYRPEAACPGTLSSPLEAHRHRGTLKSSSPLREDELNVHSDRGQPNGTASEKNSPSFHPFQTGVSFRNSVEEDHIESLHGSGTSGTSSRGSNVQKPEAAVAEDLKHSQHSAAAPTNRSQSQKSKATFLSHHIETDAYLLAAEENTSLQQRRKLVTDMEEEKMGKMSHQTDHHDSSIDSISEGTLPSEGSLSDEEANAPHPSNNHVKRTADHFDTVWHCAGSRVDHDQRYSKFQTEAMNFSPLNLPLAQHDNSKAAWEELNRGSHTSVVNIFIKNLQGHIKANERNSPSIHSLQTGVSSRNSVDENHIESLHSSAASVTSSRGSNAQSLELDSQRSVSDRPEVASPGTPGSPLEVDPPSESLKSISPARSYNLNAGTTAHSDRAQPSSTDELQFSHTALQHLMAAELHGLDSSHMSHRQLVDLERLRGISMAQQETVSLAQILKAKLHLHEREQSELKVKAERDALEAKLHLEENRQSMARANVELQERLAATQKTTLEGLQEVTAKMTSKQAEVAQYTADTARHIKEMTKLAHSQIAGALAVTPGATSGSTIFVRQKEQQPQYNTDSDRSRMSDRRTRQAEHQSSLNTSSQSDSVSFRRPNLRGRDNSNHDSPVHVTSANRNVMKKETTAVKYTKKRAEERVDSDLSRSSIEEDVVTAANDSLPSDSIPPMLNEKANSSSVATECSLKLDGSVTEDEVAESSFRSLLPSEAQRRGTLEKSHHLEKSEEDRASHHASLVSEAHSSIKSQDVSIAFSGGQDSFSQFTMDMARQFMKDDELRLQHQSFLLRIRQKALKEKTKTELAWLEHQKRTLRDKGEDDKMPPIRKKQRGLLLKLQQEQAEIKRLQEANKVARKERQLLLKQQEEIERMRNSTLRLKERLKCAGAETPETPMRESLTSEAAFPSTGPADEDVRSPSPPLSVSGSETSSIMQKLKKMHSHMNEKFLTKREQQLMHRRYRAEELLQWKQRLDQEEAEVRRMEKEALAVCGQQTPQGNDCNTVETQEKDISDIGPSHHRSSEHRAHDEKEYVGDGACSSTVSESSIHTDPLGSQQPEISSTEQPASAPDTPVSSIQTSPRDYPDDFVSSVTSPGIQSFQSPPLKGSISKATAHSEDGSKTKMQLRSTSRSPSPAQNQARSQFTESSVSIQAESISDQSDIESRIRALKEELKKRKFMANQLKKEQKKRQKERLKAQEASLLKQLESYNDLIEKTQAELNKKPDPMSQVKDATSATAQSRIKSPPSLRSETGKTADPERICDSPADCNAVHQHDHSRSTTLSEELCDEDVLTVPSSPVFDSPENLISGQRSTHSPEGILRPSSKEVHTQLAESKNENLSDYRFVIKEKLEDEVKYSLEEQHSECFLKLEKNDGPESQEKLYISKQVSSAAGEEPQYSPSVSLKQDTEIRTVKSSEEDHVKSLIIPSNKWHAVVEDSQLSPRAGATDSNSKNSCTHNAVTPSSKKEALINDAKTSSLEDYPSDFESSVDLSSREDHHGSKSASQIAVSLAKTNSSSKRIDGKATDSSQTEEIEEDIPEELSCFSNPDDDGSHSDVLLDLNLQKEDLKLNNFQSHSSQTPPVSSLQTQEQEQKGEDLLQKFADKVCNTFLNDAIAQFSEIKKAKNKKVKASNQLTRNVLVETFEEGDYASSVDQKEESEEPSSPELCNSPKSAVLGASGQEELVKRLAELELSRELLDELGDEEQTPPRPKLPLPPPPKLPEQPAMVVPHSAAEVEKMVHAATLEIWIKYNLEKEGVLTCPPLPKPKASQEYLGSEASSEDQEALCIRSYKKVVYDLTWEILHEIFGDNPNANLPEWAKPQRVKNPIFQRVKMTCDVGRVQEFITAEILNLYGFTEDQKKPDWQKMLKFGRKKRDKVDQILAQELHEEESQWVTYDEDELSVKNQLADSLFDMLLKDTANTLTQIFDKKAKRDALS